MVPEIIIGFYRVFPANIHFQYLKTFLTLIFVEIK